MDPIDAFDSENYDLTVYVLQYDPGADSIIAMDPDDSFPPEPEEIDFALYDMNGERVYAEDIENDDDYPEWDEVESVIEDEIRNLFSSIADDGEPLE